MPVEQRPHQNDSSLGARFAGVFRAFLAVFCNHQHGPPVEWPSDAEPLFAQVPQYGVLVVEDDLAFLEATSQQLRAASLHVLKANSASVGLDMIRQSPGEIAVLLLDYDLPGLNGADALSQARSINQKINIIGISGLDLNDVPLTFREGVDMFIRKPFSGDELITSVRRVIEDSFGPPRLSSSESGRSAATAPAR